MFKVVLITLAIALGVFGFLVAKQPDEFRFERSLIINAPAAKIFEQVNNSRNVNSWSPWLELDPNAKVGYEGPDAGVGSVSTWDGDKNIGAGRSSVIESRENELVRTKLEFFKPFKAVNTAEFVLEPQGEQTKVTWVMYGPNTLMGKIMSVIMNCEKMMYQQFDKGLAALKAKVEAK